jgi:hypothetical protein
MVYHGRDTAGVMVSVGNILCSSSLQVILVRGDQTDEQYSTLDRTTDL